MKVMDHTALLRLTRDELRALRPLTPDQLRALQEHVRSQQRCGSLQTADGLPCMKQPRFGWTVCNKHGERAPQTVAKAERLLAVARMPAIEWILEALDQAQQETCDHCGFPSQSLKEKKRFDMMAFRLLDRTGFGPHSKVDFNVSRSDDAGIPLENWNDEERGLLRSLLTQVRALKDRVAYRLASDIGRQARDTVEGEVVQQTLAESSDTSDKST